MSAQAEGKAMSASEARKHRVNLVAQELLRLRLNGCWPSERYLAEIVDECWCKAERAVPEVRDVK